MTHKAIRSLESILAELDLRDLGEEAAAIAKRNGVLVTEMLGPRKLQQFAEARHEWWAVMRSRRWSFPRIAAMTGHDHTTVMEGVRQHYRRLVRAA